MIVVSITNPRKLHIVNIVGSRVTCDCERFKMERLCAHTLVASHHKEILHDVVSSWQPKLSNLVSSSIPKKTGKKPGPTRYRPSRQAQERNVQVLEAPDTQYQFQDQDKLKITWLHRSKITTCYGYKNKFRKTASDPVPTEPMTLFSSESKSERIP